MRNFLPGLPSQPPAPEPIYRVIVKIPALLHESRVHKSEAPVTNDMRVVLEDEAAMHPNEASAQKNPLRVHGSTARPQIEEA
jgi:hypothetical protein